MSNPEWYKYDWIWVKNTPVGFVNAKLKPMNRHEVICVFSDGTTANGSENNMVYYPQGLVEYGKVTHNSNKPDKDNTYYRPSWEEERVQEYTGYPTMVLYYDKPKKPVHPTQKPISLLAYLIKTYTREGETVLDNTMGSGSTGVAAVKTGRNFIGYEKDEKYFDIAKRGLRGRQMDNALKFEGLFERPIAPMVIDGMVELHDKGYMLIEVVNENRKMLGGQKLTIERMINDLSASGKKCVAVIVDGSGRDVSSQKVVSVYFQDKGWGEPNCACTARQFARAFVEWVEG